MSEDDLADYLRLGSIIDIRFPVDFETNRPKGFAYVEFSNREDLVAAVQMDGSVGKEELDATPKWVVH